MKVWRMATSFSVWVAIAAIALTAGCDSGPKMSPVEGVIKQNGKPLERIMVEFWPEASGPRSIGTTDAEGKFSLMADDGKTKGAVVGKHKVVLKDVSVLGDKFLGRAAEDTPMGTGKKPRIAAEYSNISTSPLTQDVGGSGTVTVDIEAAAKL